MKIVIYHCRDTMFTGEQSLEDVRVTEVTGWESLIALMTKERPLHLPYPCGKTRDSPEMYSWRLYVDADLSVVGPQRAVLAALAARNFAVGTTSWAGAQAEKDYGYYAVIED